MSSSAEKMKLHRMELAQFLKSQEQLLGLIVSLLGEGKDEMANVLSEKFKKTTTVGYTELLLAVCEEQQRLVHAGGYIRWNNNTWYRHDQLLPYATQKITIRYPKHDPRFVFAFLGKKLLCAAPVAERYGFLDPRAAQEQSRLNQVAKQQSFSQWCSAREYYQKQWDKGDKDV